MRSSTDGSSRSAHMSVLNCFNDARSEEKGTSRKSLRVAFEIRESVVMACLFLAE